MTAFVIAWLTTVPSVVVTWGPVIIAMTTVVVAWAVFPPATSSATIVVVVVARITRVIRAWIVETLTVIAFGRPIISSRCRGAGTSATSLFDGHILAHQVCGVECGDSRLSFLGRFHSHEAETARLAGMRVIHDRCFFNPANLREGSFKITRVDT
jgi:hypothetical protein